MQFIVSIPPSVRASESGQVKQSYQTEYVFGRSISASSWGAYDFVWDCEWVDVTKENDTQHSGTRSGFDGVWCDEE